MTDNSEKIYPVSTDAVAEMLGLKPSLDVPAEPESHAESPVEVLPVEAKIADPHAGAESPVAHNLPAGLQENKAKSLIKSVLPYLLVFIVGLVMYYFFFSNTSLNLSALVKPKIQEQVAPLTVKDTALMSLQKDSVTLDNYHKWIAQFYFEVSDSAVIDPNADNSGNGLTNFQKFLLGLNPKAYDTLGLGSSDSEAVSSGINPLTGGPLTAKQKDIVDKYFDLEIINNRLAVEHLRRGGLVAGESTQNQPSSPFNTPVTSAQIETPRNGVKAVQRQNNRPTGNPVAGGFDNPVNPEINTSDLNLDTPGRLEVPALNINVPIIFTKDSKNFEKDLQLGVVHYPGTAIPGQIGTTYISGHSSNYAWARGNYNQVFSRLGDLPDNSSFKITVVQKNGKDARFHYVVTHRKEFSPTDQEQFRNAGESVVALSTCWPVGSTKSRLVVFGKLTQIEK